jgi:hypothetical protein
MVFAGAAVFASCGCAHLATVKTTKPRVPTIIAGDDQLRTATEHLAHAERAQPLLSLGEDLSAAKPSFQVLEQRRNDSSAQSIYNFFVARAAENLERAKIQPWQHKIDIVNGGSDYILTTPQPIDSEHDPSRYDLFPTDTFDIDLPLSGHDGIECRTGGASGDHQVIMTFATPVTVNGNPQAEVKRGIGQIGTGGSSNGGIVSVNGAVVTVPLTNVANAQTVTIRLNNVSDGTYRNNVSVPMGVLVGDVNATRLVDGTDVSLVQQHTGKTANSTNFRFDVDASGLIDANDVSQVQSHIGTSLPPPH